MRRTLAVFMMIGVAGWACALAAPAQQQEPPKEPPKEQINLQIPPPPPPPEEPAKLVITPPEKVFLPAAAVAVVLDTPMSTRITKKGGEVVFVTTEPIQVADGIELPPDTRIVGTVVEAKRPGIFGRPGGLKIKIERIEVQTQAAPVAARLEGVDTNEGKIKSDSTRTANLYTLATWSLSGTLMGAQVGGGKGALIGGGAGAAAALIIAMSRRGPDLYLEPGTPFSIVLEEPVELAGAQVYAAQQKYEEVNGSASRRRLATEEETLESANDPSRPKLTRRPKPPQP